MRILHAYNKHRNRGGADHVADATVRLSRERGIDAHAFVRDSRDLPPGLRGRVVATAGGVYARGAVRALEAELERLSPDLVHVHELYPMISPWILPRCRAAGVPVVMSCSDYRLTCPVTTHFRRGGTCVRCAASSPIWSLLGNCRESLAESASYALFAYVRRWFRPFERHVARFVMPSDYARRWTAEHVDVPSERFVTVHPPVTIPPAPVEDPSRGTYVGFAGRFAAPKGVGVLAQAARRCGLPLRLAGDADRLPGVEPSPDVTFVRTKGPGELATFYRGARMLCVPSLSFETFGMVAAEAMSHGVPVLASDIGALRETVADGRTGLLFAPGDATDLAAKLEPLWNDPDRVRAYGAAGRERARERWAPDVHVERLVATYEDVLDGRGRATGSAG